MPKTNLITADALRPREAFRISRSLEYFSEAELTKQIGYRRELWLLAIVKELVDNAIDNAEEAGILPDVTVSLATDKLVVTDNGTGIRPETVHSMLDFTQRISSREAYRSITRGAQGNATKSVLGLPVVINGGSGQITITAQGWRHEINVTLDTLANQPVVQHDRTPVDVQIGTIVEISIPQLPCILTESTNARLVLLAAAYSSLNPHLRLELLLPDGMVRDWERTAEVCRKWTAAEADPPGWHDLASLERLVSACIVKDREDGTDRLLRDFVRQFAGLRRSDALKAVFEETGLSRSNLSELVNCDGLDHNKTSRLLESMQRNGTTPKPERLGCIGRKHIAEFFADEGAENFKYRKAIGTHAGLPFVVEAAFGELAEITDSAVIITGVNYTPSIDRPVVRTLDSILSDQKIDDASPVLLLLHIATVAPTYLDRGKSVIDVGGKLEEAIEQCVAAVTDAYAKQRKAEERDADRRRRRLERAAKSRPDTSLKDAILEVLPEAITNASGGGVCEFDDRDLYYAARTLVQSLTDAELSQKYFDHVIDQWEIENALIEGRLRSPRGFLLEPHTGQRIPLGTKAIDEYVIPKHLYDTLIYVEKKGLLAKFEYGQIAERFDVAIICAEGYAVKAAKALIQAAQTGHKMKVLCIHDADPAGYNIARTLSRSTGAHKYKIKVIDAGLHLAEALEMGLAVETFSRKNALPKGLTLDALELEYFGGESQTVSRNGRHRTQWINCQRVELNALSANPQAFVAWVERILTKHGVANKVVPPKRVITEHAASRRRSMLRDEIQFALERAFDIETKIDILVKSFLPKIPIEHIPGKVAKWANKLKPERWTTCVEGEVRRSVAKLDERITTAVAKLSEVDG